MKLDFIADTLSNLGLDSAAIAELSAIAEKLPEANIAAAVNGLDETETATLVSHLLQHIAPDLGVTFQHEDLISSLGFPIYQPRQDEGNSHAATVDAAGQDATQYDSAS